MVRWLDEGSRASEQCVLRVLCGLHVLQYNVLEDWTGNRETDVTFAGRFSLLRGERVWHTSVEVGLNWMNRRAVCVSWLCVSRYRKRTLDFLRT